MKYVFAFVLLLSSLVLAQRSADQWYETGFRAFARGDYATAERAFSQAVQLNSTAAHWRWLGEARVKLENYDGATSAFAKAIGLYRAQGDQITANALQNRTNQYRQEALVYLLNQSVPPPRSLARLEPVSGLLLGCYVDEAGIVGNDFAIDQRLGAGLAVYFRYHKLVRPEAATVNNPVFPTRLAAVARKAGAALHLALEPSVPLSQVTESMLSAFARGVRDAGLPVFVRFASEFNDPSSPWGRDPRLYVEKFRLAADVIHRIAPNAAMVWMPMSSRLEVLDLYYPGASYVDWAGLSLYSPPFANGDKNQSNRRVSPLDAIQPFYDKYAARHPIQISEYAASHETTLTPGVDYSSFAAQKMRMLYWGAMLRFPRLKNINWLDLDMIRSRFITPSRAAERRNNYSLFTNPAKLEAFRELLLEPYFLRSVNARVAPRPVALGTVPANTDNLELGAWVKTFEPFIAKVEFSLNGQRFASLTTLPYRFKLPRLAPGAASLTLRAFDIRGKLLLTRNFAFNAR